MDDEDNKLKVIQIFPISTVETRTQALEERYRKRMERERKKRYERNRQTAIHTRLPVPKPPSA